MLNLVVREIVERAQNDRLEHHNRIPRLASRPRFAHLVRTPPHRLKTGAQVELLSCLRELGISLVAWAPLGRGLLTGVMSEPAEGDIRQAMPEFAGEKLIANRDRFAPLTDLAREIGATPAQLALSWLLHQGPDIIPIPGSDRLAYLHENVAAVDLTLSADMLAQINRLASPGVTEGST